LDCKQADDTLEYYNLSTQNVKKITQLFGLITDNVECNIKYSPTGMDVFAMYFDKTVCIRMRLGRDMFSDYACSSTPVVSTYNLGVLAKKLSVLNKFKPERFTWKNKGTNLVISAFSTKRPKSEVEIHSLSVGIEELDLSSFKYDILIEVPTQDLYHILESMPLVFQIKVNVTDSCITFSGDEDHSKISMSIPLPAEVNHEVKNHPEVSQYQASFLRTYLSPLIKSAKISNNVVLGFRDGTPLFTRFIIQQSTDHVLQDDTDICMYFASRYTDEEM